MNKFNYMITAFDDSEVEFIKIRLGDCQSYRDKISKRMLAAEGINLENGNSENGKLGFFQLLKILKKRKELIVTFYGIKNNDQLHIFSDFYNLEEAFSDCFSFFDEVGSVLMLSENTGDSIRFHLIRSGEIMAQFEDDPSQNTSWRQDYEKIRSGNSTLPEISAIESTLDFLRNSSERSDKQMQEYLINNALFKDEYIL